MPLKLVLVDKLRAYAKGKADILFPYWDGTEEGKKKATRALVQSFRRLFAQAKVQDFKEHDLRHEACCRWFELRGKDGRWLYSDVEICKIMGWTRLLNGLEVCVCSGRGSGSTHGGLGVHAHKASSGCSSPKHLLAVQPFWD